MNIGDFFLSVKELKGITPLYQTELTKQLGAVLGNWNQGNLFDMYVALKGLVALLNLQHREELLKNDVAHLEDEIERAMKTHRIDLYQTRQARRNSTVGVLRKNLYNLLLKVMKTLHDGKYLELYREYASGRELGY